MNAVQLVTATGEPASAASSEFTVPMKAAELVPVPAIGPVGVISVMYTPGADLVKSIIEVSIP